MSKGDWHFWPRPDLGRHDSLAAFQLLGPKCMASSVSPGTLGPQGLGMLQSGLP